MMMSPLPKQVMKFSDFWRESKIALKSGLYHEYWELTPWQKAWLIAAFETQDLIAHVVDTFGRDSED